MFLLLFCLAILLTHNIRLDKWHEWLNLSVIIRTSNTKSRCTPSVADPFTRVCISSRALLHSRLLHRSLQIYYACAAECVFFLNHIHVYMPPTCLQIVLLVIVKRVILVIVVITNNKIESAVQPIGTNRFLLLTGKFIMIICVLCRPCLCLSSCEHFSYIDKYHFFTTGFVRNHNTLQYINVNDDNDDIRNTDISLNINANRLIWIVLMHSQRLSRIIII